LRLIERRPRSDLIASELSDLIETVCFDQGSEQNLYLLGQFKYLMSAREYLRDPGSGFTTELQVKMVENKFCISSGKTARGNRE
jgi:hypothetical protein